MKTDTWVAVIVVLVIAALAFFYRGQLQSMFLGSTQNAMPVVPTEGMEGPEGMMSPEPTAMDEHGEMMSPSPSATSGADTMMSPEPTSMETGAMMEK